MFVFFSFSLGNGAPQMGSFFYLSSIHFFFRIFAPEKYSVLILKLYH